MIASDNIRRELARLCSRERTRTAVFSDKAPTKWHPERGYDIRTGQPFTRVGAWERVKAELENGCELWPVPLDHPPGKTGYSFEFDDARGTRIYVKLQLASGIVIGRSFHEDRKNDA